jgi:hypothetical protein
MKPMKPSAEDRVRWYRPSGADLAFLVLAVLTFLAGRRNMLDDPGLGWHLRTVDVLREQGTWPTRDPYSLPGPGRQPARWLANQWLGDVPLWLGERWAGLEGIVAVCALTLALTLACLYRMLLRDGLPWPVALIWTALAALGTSPSWVARPNLFTLLFFLLTMRACEQFHQGKWSRVRMLWLLPLFAIWANVHGGFVAGLGLVAITFAIECVLGLFSPERPRRQAALDRAIFLFGLLAGAVVCTGINPYGFGLYPWMFQLLGNDFFMNLHLEWRSPDFHGAGAFRFELVMLLLPLLLGVTQRRPNLVELTLTVATLHLALTGFRYVALFVLVATPLLARSSVEIPALQELARRFNLTPEKAPLLAPQPQPLPWLWTTVGALAVVVGAKTVEGRFAGHNPKYIPAAALDRLLAMCQERMKQMEKEGPNAEVVVFHSYNWGGYLTWKGWPGIRNWIDDRNEVQGQSRVEEYFQILNAEPGWERKLERAGVELVCIPPNVPLAERLERSPREWKRVYPTVRGEETEDWHREEAVIFRRFPPEPDSAIAAAARRERGGL